jgi:hypothetical protein
VGEAAGVEVRLGPGAELREDGRAVVAGPAVAAGLRERGRVALALALGLPGLEKALAAKPSFLSEEELGRARVVRADPLPRLRVEGV